MRWPLITLFQCTDQFVLDLVGNAKASFLVLQLRCKDVSHSGPHQQVCLAGFIATRRK